MSMVTMSVEPSSWPQGDCIGCSCDGGVGNILESSADAKILTPPAVKCWPPSVVIPPPGDGCAGAIRNLLPIRAVSSGMPDGLFDPGGVGTGHCIARVKTLIIGDVISSQGCRLLCLPCRLIRQNCRKYCQGPDKRPAVQYSLIDQLV